MLLLSISLRSVLVLFGMRESTSKEDLRRVLYLRLIGRISSEWLRRLVLFFSIIFLENKMISIGRVKDGTSVLQLVFFTETKFKFHLFRITDNLI